jgi:hypothetical protein
MSKQVVFPDQEVVVLEDGRAFQMSRKGVVFSLDKVAELHPDTPPDPNVDDLHRAIIDASFAETLVAYSVLKNWPLYDLLPEYRKEAKKARLVSAQKYLAEGGDQ